MSINRLHPLQNATGDFQEPNPVQNISLKHDWATMFLKEAAVFSLVISISSIAAGAFLLLSGFGVFSIGAYSIGAKSLFILGGLTAIIGIVIRCLSLTNRKLPLPTSTQTLALAQTETSLEDVLQPQDLSSQVRTMVATFFAAGFFAEAMEAHIDGRLPRLSTPETIRDVHFQYNLANRHAKWSGTWAVGENLKVTDAIKLFNKDNYPFILRCLSARLLKTKTDWTQFIENLPLGRGAVITMGNDSVAIRHVNDHCWEFFNPQSLYPFLCRSLNEVEGYIQRLSRANVCQKNKTMEAFVLVVT